MHLAFFVVIALILSLSPDCICEGNTGSIGPRGFPALSPGYISLFIYFTSAAVAVDSSHMTASSSTWWSIFSPPSNFVNGQSPVYGDWARPHLCKLAWHGPWPVQKRFVRDHVWRGRSKPSCLVTGSLTVVWISDMFLRVIEWYQQL